MTRAAGLLVAALLAACRTPDSGPPPQAAPTLDADLREGMRFDEALRRIEGAGGYPIPCDYGDRGFRRGWFVLPGGFGLHLEGDPLFRLEMCNSTMLFCCRRETWYPVQGAKLESPARPVWLAGDAVFKGMTLDEARAVVRGAGLEMRPGDAPGEQRVPLPADADLLLQTAAGRVSLLLIEATRAGTPPEFPPEVRRPAKRVRIECELVNLWRPLDPYWHAVDDAHLWEAGDPDRSERLRRAGQTK